MPPPLLGLLRFFLSLICPLWSIQALYVSFLGLHNFLSCIMVICVSSHFPHQNVDILKTESILKSCLWPLVVLHTLRIQYLFHGWTTVSYLWERNDSLAQTHRRPRETSLSLMVAKIMYCGDYFILLSRFGKGKNKFVWGLTGAF